MRSFSNKYKSVYDNSQYYNQQTGKINWPQNDGFASKQSSVAKPGQVFDRYGESTGEYMSPKGTPYEQRALAPHSSEANYYQYEVKKPFNIIEGEAAPYFDQPGGGTQLYGVDKAGNKMTIDQLIKGKYLKEIK